MTDLRIGVIGVGGRGGFAAYAHQPGAGCVHCGLLRYG
jgi:predicted dehydrogenase